MIESRNSRPVVGAAVMASDLADDPALCAFLMERDRDVEVQDVLLPDVIRDQDALNERIAVVSAKLDGHRGRLGIHGPFFDFNLDTQDPDVRDIASRRLVSGVMACAALASADRAPHMVVHSPFSTWNWHNMAVRPRRRVQKINAALETMGAAVARAQAEGVTIVIENIEDKDPRDRMDLAQAFNSDSVQVSLDTGHAHYAHRATGAPPVDAFVRSAGRSLAHVHLQDGDGYADRHWRLGEGDIPWAAVFRAIGETGSQPRLILEMHRPSDVLPSAQFLRDAGLAD